MAKKFVVKKDTRPMLPKVELPPISKNVVYGPHQLITLENYNLSLKKSKGNIYEITVETDETLGHFADWAKIKTQKIRNRWF